MPISIAIVKTGSTLAHLSSRRGDLEEWILSGIGRQRERAVVLDVQNGSRLPKPDQVVAACQDTAQSRSLLRRFAEIAR